MYSYIIIGKLGPLFDIKTDYNSKMIEFSTRVEAQNYINILNKKVPYHYKIITFKEYMESN